MADYEQEFENRRILSMSMYSNEFRIVLYKIYADKNLIDKHSPIFMFSLESKRYNIDDTTN